MAAARPNPIVYLLFVLSGATGLVYELVWTRELIFVFGGTTHAISTVLVAFMGGLGLGSYLAGRFSRSIREPGRLYGVIEIAIGGYALLVPWLLGLAEPLYRAIYPSVAEQPTTLTLVRFAVGALVLIVPTTMMGATLPILVRHVAQHAGDAARWVGIMYGINTLGAVLGTLATGFYLIPTVGLTATTWLAAGTNIGIGLIALVMLRAPEHLRAASPKSEVRSQKSEIRGQNAEGRTSVAEIAPAVQRVVLITFALSGFSAMLYQIAWTRALILSIGSSTYSFTCILATFILGLALGSIVAARFVDRLKNPVLAIGIVQMAVGVTAVLIQPIFGRVPLIVHGLVSAHHDSYDTLLRWQFGLIMLITIVPTFLMGTLFPLITRVISATDHDPAAATGRAYAVNTIGTILGSFLGGFVLLQCEFTLRDGRLEYSGGVLGAQNSIIAASLLSAAIGAWLIYLTMPAALPVARRALPGVIGLVLVRVVAYTAGEWDRMYLNTGPFRLGRDPEGFKARNDLLYMADGVDMTVAVTQIKGDASLRSLIVNAKADASTALPDMTTQLLQGHIPVLMNPRARKVCIIGLGSGMTLAAVARHPQLERIDCVEISEEVIRANEYFRSYCYDVLASDKRVHMIRNDGRNHLLLTDQTYDVIISEPSNPWIAGVANLFTREYFTICDRRLAAGGVYCLWLQGYTISKDNFRLVARTLAERFPFVSVWDTSTNDYAMIAGREPFRVPMEDFLSHFNQPAVRQDLYRIATGQPGSLLGRFIVSGRPVMEWVDAGGEIHTDDNARLEFSAPRQLYRDDDLEITGALLERGAAPWDEVVTPRGDDATHAAIRRRAEAAFAARRLRYESDRIKQAQSRPGAMAQPRAVVQPLLDAMRRDPGNVEIWTRLDQAGATLRQHFGSYLKTPDGEALLTEMRSVRVPTLASREWRPYEAIAATLRQFAKADVRRDHVANAIDYLREARELSPGLAAVRIELAAALAAAGERAAAVAELRAALSEGVVDRAALLQAEELAALRSTTEFEEILSE